MRFFLFYLLNSLIMSNLRSVRRKQFTQIDNAFLRNNELSLEARGLLSICLSYSEEWNFTLKELAKVAKKGRDTMGKYMNELINAGYVYRERKRNEKGHLSISDYVFSDDKEDIKYFIDNEIKPMSKIPTLDRKNDKKPMSEIPTLENPTLENPITIKENKKEENKKEENNSLLTRVENFKNEAEEIYNNYKESFPNVDLKAYLNYWTEYSPGEMMFKAEKTGSFNHFNRFISWNDKEPKFAPKTGKNDNSNRITDGNELRNYFRQQAIEAEKNK